MFAVYMAIASIALYIIKNLQINKIDRDSRKQAIREGRDAYYDVRNQMMCDVYTGTLFETKFINGDRCRVGKNGQIIKNYSAEERDRIERAGREKCAKDGTRYYLWKKDGYSSRVEGDWFKCIDDDKIYVKRGIGGAFNNAWVDIETGLIKELDLSQEIDFKKYMHWHKCMYQHNGIIQRAIERGNRLPYEKERWLSGKTAHYY